jgi:hypothetical protein
VGNSGPGVAGDYTPAFYPVYVNADPDIPIL